MLTQDLALLERRGLVRVTTVEAKPVVRFKHALTREATYNSILQSRRAELHCVVARALAETHAQLDLELALSIAEHQLYCRDDASMVDFLLPFAARLIYTGRSASLTRLLTQADRSALTEAQRRAADMALADAHAARGEYEAARDLYQRLLTAAPADAARARLLQSLGVAHYHLGQYAEANQNYHASLDLAEAERDIALQAKTTGGLGLVYLALGETARAEKFLLKSRDLGAALGESMELAAAEYNLAGAQRATGQYAAAIQNAEHALAIYQKFNHALMTARSLQLIGICYHSAGDLELAANYYRRAIDDSLGLGDSMAVAIVQSNLAELYTEQEKLDRALELYALAIQYFRMSKQEAYLAYNLAGLAYAQTLQAKKNKDETTLLDSQRLALEALQIAQKSHSLELEGIALRTLSAIFLERNDFAQAETHARTSLERLTRVGSLLELERTQRVYAEVLQRVGAGTRS